MLSGSVFNMRYQIYIDQFRSNVVKFSFLILNIKMRCKSGFPFLILLDESQLLHHNERCSDKIN